MSESRSAHQIEFIKLDGHAVRVTSWRPGDVRGTYTLVTITRGSRDAELLDELLAQERIELQVGGEGVMSVTARGIDRRTVGAGESGITRFSTILTKVDAENSVVDDAPMPSLEDRITALEAELERLRSLVRDHANGIRH